MDGLSFYAAFFGGAFIGVIGISLIAHLCGGMAETQCEAQAGVAECVLMWVPK